MKVINLLEDAKVAKKELLDIVSKEIEVEDVGQTSTAISIRGKDGSYIHARCAGFMIDLSYVNIVKAREGKFTRIIRSIKNSSVIKSCTIGGVISDEMKHFIEKNNFKTTEEYGVISVLVK